MIVDMETVMLYDYLICLRLRFFSNFKLSISSGKHLEDISHAHLVSLLYKRTTSNKDSDDLSIGFGRIHDRRRDELAQNENIKIYTI